MNIVRTAYRSVAFALFFSLVLISSGFARPYFGEKQVFTQPDGSTISLLLYGDEFFIRAETLDGYTVVRDKKSGWLCYALLSETGDDFVSSGIPVETGKIQAKGLHFKKGLKLSHNAMRKKVESTRSYLFNGKKPEYMERMEALAKSASAPQSAMDSLPAKKDVTLYTGECFGLCVIFDFPDEPITDVHPSADSAVRFMERKFNSLEPSDNSLRYTFQIWSGGKFDVQFMVKGVFRAPNTFAYYDGLQFAEGHCQLVNLACEQLEAEGFDFSQLSTSSNRVRGLTIANTGRAAAWAEGMWMHSGSLRPSFSADGVTLSRYCTCGATGGALTHEMGHLLGNWPDLYASSGEVTGVWDIMGSGGGTSLPCPYLLYINGWNDVLNIANLSGGTVVTASGLDPNVGHIYFRNAITTEYFFFKPYTQDLPLCERIYDEGLTIWRINTRGNNFNYPSSPLLVEMVHANNDISNIRENVCFKASGSDAYSGTTTPAANWVDGTWSGIDIIDISDVGDTMTFTIGSNTGANHSGHEHMALKPYGIRLENRGGALKLVQWGIAQNRRATVALCTPMGRNVFNKTIVSGKGADVSHLPGGVYIARVSSPAKSMTERIVIAK